MEPVERVSILDQVVDKLRQYIVEEEISIGDRMPSENELGEMLKVGRSTIREAFRVLQTLGYLKIRTGRGAYVLNKENESSKNYIKWFMEHGVELAEFVEVRMAIEPLAARLAADRATKKEINELSKILESFEDALSKKDGTKLAILDESFHHSIIKSSQNRLLSSINEKIAECFFDYRCRVFSVDGYAAHALQPHQSIYRALSNRDGKQAEIEMIRHLTDIFHDITQLRKQPGNELVR